MAFRSKYQHSGKNAIRVLPSGLAFNGHDFRTWRTTHSQIPEENNQRRQSEEHGQLIRDRRHGCIQGLRLVIDYADQG
ncbi:MAG: hypothetical protein ACK56F_04600 [bacterium]